MYNSRDLQYKTPFGAIPTGETVTFRLLLDCVHHWTEPQLLLTLGEDWEHPQSLPMHLHQATEEGLWYEVSWQSAVPQLVFYHFQVTRDGETLLLKRSHGGQGTLGHGEGEHWQLTVYDREYTTPRSLWGGIYYQIFPDRFSNSGTPKEGVPADRSFHQNWGELPDYLPNDQGEITNSDYFGGDLEGIRQKLPYLKELGITVLYLNPIFEAHSNHRYNTADYRSIDPLLGKEEDFVRLAQEAKSLGISLLLDGVFSHTGSDSLYFNRDGRYPTVGAYQSQESPYYSWYQFQEFPNRYACWWGFETLPEVREENPDYQAFICGPGGVIRHWMRLGACGYRLDVADELPDGMLETIRQAIREENPQGLLIGEVWEDASNKISYGQRRKYLLGKQLDGVMNYPFQNAVLAYIRQGDAPQLLETVLSILENYPKPSIHVLMNALSTHDSVRALTALGGEPYQGQDRTWQAQHHQLSPQAYHSGKELLKLAAILQFFLPGIPCIYYGDEAGRTGYRDPFNRCTYPWGQEDSELLSFYQRLSKARRESPATADGDFLPLSITSSLCVFVRKSQKGETLVAINRSQEALPLPIPPAFEGITATLLCGDLQGHLLGGFSGAVWHHWNSCAENNSFSSSPIQQKEPL